MSQIGNSSAIYSATVVEVSDGEGGTVLKARLNQANVGTSSAVLVQDVYAADSGLITLTQGSNFHIVWNAGFRRWEALLSDTDRCLAQTVADGQAVERYELPGIPKTQAFELTSGTIFDAGDSATLAGTYEGSSYSGVYTWQIDVAGTTIGSDDYATATLVHVSGDNQWSLQYQTVEPYHERWKQHWAPVTGRVMPEEIVVNELVIGTPRAAV